jgi:hypothetical protein
LKGGADYNCGPWCRLRKFGNWLWFGIRLCPIDATISRVAAARNSIVNIYIYSIIRLRREKKISTFNTGHSAHDNSSR